MLTGYLPHPALAYPSLGAVVAHLRERQGGLPPYVAVPSAGPSEGPGYLPTTAAPFGVGGDPAKADFRVRDLDAYPGLDALRLERPADVPAGAPRGSAGKPKRGRRRGRGRPRVRAGVPAGLVGRSETRLPARRRASGRARPVRPPHAGPGLPAGQAAGRAGGHLRHRQQPRLGHPPGPDPPPPRKATRARVGVGLVPTLDQALSGTARRPVGPVACSVRR